MAVMRRHKAWYIYFRPYKQEKIGIKLPPDVYTKQEAGWIEAKILRACRTGIFADLDSLSREVCIKMFQNRRWQLPPELCVVTRPTAVLDLWKAVELFMTRPETQAKSVELRQRYTFALMRVVEFFGKDRPLAAITVPELKAYQVERQRQGMAGDTINREIGTLSLVFQSMNELELVNGNPCKLVKRLSSKEGQREAYVSLADVQRIADACPEWFARMIWASFYSGMRRGEILGLRRSQVNLGRRIIRLGAEDVKENRSKRIPIAMPLIPILQEAMKVTAIGPDLVFLMVDERGVRPPSIEGAKNPFARACHKLNLPRPWPTLHDMRHTFRANCRRSGVDPDVAEAILGHADRVKGVRERYGRISDEELVRGIDQVSWDYGPTEIYVARERGKALEKGNSVVTGKAEKEKNQVATLPLAQ